MIKRTTNSSFTPNVYIDISDLLTKAFYSFFLQYYK
jgi:hypothetical protein